MSEKPPITRILLGEAASQALTETGEKSFAIISRASVPDDPKRWVIHLVPIEWETARNAERVLFGKARAVTIKTK